jgi:hypothetical protein
MEPEIRIESSRIFVFARLASEVAQANNRKVFQVRTEAETVNLAAKLSP